MWGDIAIAFLLAFITTLVLTPYTIKIAKKIGAVDVPKDDRRMHTKPMPKFGGPAIIVGFLLSSIYLIITSSIEGNLDLFGAESYFIKLIGFLLGILVLSFVCFFDDIKGINPFVKLTGQIIAAGIVVAFGIRIDNFTLPFCEGNIVLNEVFSIVITMIWIVGITNAINLIDGLDGLSTGISIISSISLLIIFALNGSPLIAIIIITALVGALSGFLPFNFNPAKTFIGDIGSNFIGFTLSIVSILGIAKTATAFVIVLPIIVLGLPIFDTLSAIVRRLIKGKSLKAVFQADKGHLHHKLIEKGFTQKEAVLILYGISVVCGMFAVILFESSIWKAISFALMVVAVVCIGYKEFFKLKEEEKKSEEGK
jgi:UDP-GlcNAc:undecaprenyl-phosphate GlcNAc-1-phosphate transferase